MPKLKKVKEEEVESDKDDDASSAAASATQQLYAEEVVGRQVMILFDMEGNTRKRMPFLGTVITYSVHLLEEEPPEPRKLPARKGKKTEAESPPPPVKPHKPQFTDEISRLHRVAFDDGDDALL